MMTQDSKTTQTAASSNAEAASTKLAETQAKVKALEATKLKTMDPAIKDSIQEKINRLTDPEGFVK